MSADRKRLCARLVKALGRPRGLTPKERRRRWEGWKKGIYDPSTGVWR